MVLRIISFNCNSIRRNDEIVCKLLNECDILLLQETLVTADLINSISNFNADFMSSHVQSRDPCIEGLHGSPRGGGDFQYFGIMSTSYG